MTAAPARAVRSAIATHVLGPDAVVGRLGEIVLHPHQHDAAERVTLLLERHGGALLADDVGLGKTFVALTVARLASRPLVLAPAALRDAWLSSATRAGVAVRFASLESLGRRGAPDANADLVVVDEAHHLRSPATKRFAAARELCAAAKVLLLTATPVQNSVRDLRTVLSLFLGHRSHAMTLDELAQFVVRRVHGDLPPCSPPLPRVSVLEWVRPVSDVDCLDRLAALPPPLPPADGDDGGALLTYSLARQWASSRAALRSALVRRIARARAMEDSLGAGRLPSRAELTAWRFADGSQQLSFPELVTRSGVDDASALLEQVHAHADATRELLAWLNASDDPDRTRAEILLEILERHRGERVVAFSEYADTVASLYRAIAPRARAAMLTHGGGRVAGGAVTRRELLAHFAPGAPAARLSDRVDALLTTDVLSEGVDLQSASVVVHLDLAWNPARLEQRVGRLRRLGAARDAIAVYAFPPPAPAERLLQLEHRLRSKLGAAARSVGIAGSILPGFVAGERAGSPVSREERIATGLRAWRTCPVTSVAPLVGAARSSVAGALACVRRDGVASLVAVTGERVSAAAQDIEALVRDADGDDVALASGEVQSVIDMVERWLKRRAVADIVRLPSASIARSRRTLLRRVDLIARHAPRHAQSHLARMLGAARSAASVPLSAGAERVLGELALAPMPDHAWLQAVGQFAALHARDDADSSAEILALLILRPSP